VRGIAIRRLLGSGLDFSEWARLTMSMSTGSTTPELWAACDNASTFLASSTTIIVSGGASRQEKPVTPVRLAAT
jgi:hypothetical protein